MCMRAIQNFSMINIKKPRNFKNITDVNVFRKSIWQGMPQYVYKASLCVYRPLDENYCQVKFPRNDHVLHKRANGD